MTLRSSTPRQSTRTTHLSAQHGAHEPTFATTPRQPNAKRKNVDRDSGKSKKVQKGDITNVSKRPIDFDTGLDNRTSTTERDGFYRDEDSTVQEESTMISQTMLLNSEVKKIIE
jgi:hypothetical protein